MKRKNFQETMRKVIAIAGIALLCSTSLQHIAYGDVAGEEKAAETAMASAEEAYTEFSAEPVVGTIDETALESVVETTEETAMESTVEITEEAADESAIDSDAALELMSVEDETRETETDVNLDYEYEQVPVVRVNSALDMIEFVESHEVTAGDLNLLEIEEDDLPAYDTELFASGRLLLMSDHLEDTAGATAVIYNERYEEYILQFDSALEAAIGYEILLETYDASQVFPDELLDLSEIETQSSGDNENWGAEYMSMYDMLSTPSGSLSPVTVAILDTGISQEVAALYPGRISADNYDFIDKTETLTDEHGHGSFAASVLLDATPSEVQLLVVRSYRGRNDGVQYASVLASYILYAHEKGASIINMSWVFGSKSNTITNTALQPLYEKGVLFICAAGNHTSNVSGYFPANSPYTLAISALKMDGTSTGEGVSFDASYSNYGAGIDFSAPGTMLAGRNLSGALTSGSGTSYASPMACAAFAWLWSQYPELSRDELIDLASERALDLGDTGRDNYYGIGCLNISDMIFTRQLLLNTETWEAEPGNMFQLQLSYLPRNAEIFPDEYIYESSDPQVATVSEDGLMTAVDGGSCVITVSAGNMSTSCKVTVNTLSGITLDQSELGLLTGDVYAFDVTVSPEGLSSYPSFTWSSSDEEVVFVGPDGRVAALAPGTATVTVTCGDFSDSCEITVTPKLEAITLDQTEIRSYPGNIITLNLSFEPEAAGENQEILWSSSDHDVVYVDQQGVLAILEEGQATITAAVGDLTATCEVTVISKEDYLIESFVSRLYRICLDREPDSSGFANWCSRLKSGSITGTQAGYGFIFSSEFKNKNLCNADYVEKLYEAFLGRSSDAAGKRNWVSRLESGATREEIFNGFAMSSEFDGICQEAGILRGSRIALPEYGTVPKGPCSICGEEDGVTQFVRRLYNLCLDRQPDAKGLSDWTSKLWNHEISGSKAAYGFFFSSEFTNKKYSDSEYVDILYRVMLGREADAAGRSNWVSRLAAGTSRRTIFEGFAGSQEFAEICQGYGIITK